MGGTCRGRGDQGGGRWEEGSSGQRMERVSLERASHLLGCAGTAPGRMGSVGAGGMDIAGALLETGSMPKPLVL